MGLEIFCACLDEDQQRGQENPLPGSLGSIWPGEPKHPLTMASPGFTNVERSNVQLSCHHSLNFCRQEKELILGKWIVTANQNRMKPTDFLFSINLLLDFTFPLFPNTSPQLPIVSFVFTCCFFSIGTYFQCFLSSGSGPPSPSIQ